MSYQFHVQLGVLWKMAQVWRYQSCPFHLGLNTQLGNSHHPGCWWVWGFKCQGRLTTARRLPCLLTLRHVGSWCQNLEIPHRLLVTRVEAEKLNIVGKLQIKLLLVVAIILQLGRRLLVSRAVSWELFTSNKIYSKGKQTEDRRHFKWLKQCKTQKSEKNMQ